MSSSYARKQQQQQPSSRSPSPFAGAGVEVGPSGPSIEHVAELIKAGQVRNVVVMAGAGISTSAGIPDFRSPETGLYANLAKYDLPYAEAIFDIDYFREQPAAFFTLSKDLYPGHFLPTRTHYFFRLLHAKGLLRRVFTQNIDTLERLAGLPEDQVVEAHGSFASSRCIRCGSVVEPDWIRERVLRGEVAYCEVERCQRMGGSSGRGGLVKPDIVFFGESLPARFFERLGDLREADLLIVLGTSLKVQPFASLIDRVPASCPRLLINLELVGEIGGGSGADDDDDVPNFRDMGGYLNESGFDFKGWATGGKQHARDVAFIGESDEGVKKIAAICGWEEELEKMMQEHHTQLKSEHAGLLKKQHRQDPIDKEPLSASETAKEVAADVGKATEASSKAPESGPSQEDLLEDQSEVSKSKGPDAPATRAEASDTRETTAAEKDLAEKLKDLSIEAKREGQ